MTTEEKEQDPYFLSYINGPEQGQKIKLDLSKPELTLGRSPQVDVSIQNQNISRKHVKFKQDIDGVWVEDLNSKNGVLVNGKKVTEPTLLKDSDEIQLGDLKLSFTDTNAALMKSLGALPAFAPPEPEKPAPEESDPEPDIKAQQAADPPALPHPAPKPWLDYVYIGLMGIVVLGILIGAAVWMWG